MNQPISNYQINIKPSQQTYTVNSIIQPDLSFLQLSEMAVIWFRQPPAAFEPQELSYNFNQLTFKCSSLDYECSIVCKVTGKDNKEVARFDYGPIETFVYNNRLSTNLQLRVQVLLFGVWKKCILALGPVPTLINPQNNSRYQLTQQDVRSIYPKPSSVSIVQWVSNNQNQSFVGNQLKKVIVVENLFQRLILLKLFHQIPNGMYCYSTEVLEMAFYDESACSKALLAVNRLKYQKRQLSEVTKSMYSPPTQELALSKFMKKSNDSFTQLKSNIQGNGSFKNNSQDTLKKEFLPLSAFANWRKSPKESINSGSESIMSGNSNKAHQSRSRLISKNMQGSRNVQDGSRQGNISHETSQYKSRVSIKQPKISILSTEITSTKQARQQKVSFPQAPPAAHNLKSSQLIIKPKEFKSLLSMRRSQDQIKTPRMDVDDQTLTVNNSKIPEPIKKKSESGIEAPNDIEQHDEENLYVNQFQNLLFEVGEDENKETQFCLNDSFAKLQQEQENQKLYIMHNPVQKWDKTPPMNQSIIHQLCPSSPTKSQIDILSMKQALLSVLEQNYQLRQKNQQLKKQICETKNSADRKNAIEKYEEEIQKMKQIQTILVREIEGLRKSVIICNNQTVDRAKEQYSPNNTIGKRQKLSVSFTQQQNILNQNEKSSTMKQQFYPGKRLQYGKYMGSVFSPARQSKAGQQLTQKSNQPSNLTFMARRSQEHDHLAFGARQTQQNTPQSSSQNIIFNSGDLRFMRLQNDPEYQKFRNNQSYSYKQSEPIKQEENKK